MKKVLASISVVFGFVGLATLVIFFVETGTFGSALPSNALTADISANNPVTAPDAAAAPANQLADISADTDTGVDTTTATVAPQAVTDTTSSSATSTATPDAEPSADQTAATPPPAATPIPTTTAIAAPAFAPIPVAPSDANDSSTLPLATATITVSPSAPAPAIPPASPYPATAAAPISYDESVFLPGNQNWNAPWGSLTDTYQNFMDLSAGPQSTGGSVYLQNESDWSNYTMSATVDWIAGRTIGLMANYDNASNYALCEYSNNGTGAVTMQLAEYINGNEIFLTPTSSVPWAGGATDIDLVMNVHGVYGSCSFNGQTISNSAPGPGITPMSFSGSGSIGFVVHGPTPDTSEIVIKDVKVVGD